ncbi:MAG: mRNA interferase MazF9 [bacterium ADurb.Bin363]|nr:MAG: mRNA interferase MazF9 [bacterium ADurb.Bin363]
MQKPSRGDVWFVELDPTRGREQAGRRPALIVSVNQFNYGPAELVVVIPITTRDKNIPFHVKINPPEGGLREISFIKCEDIRSVSKERLIKFSGRISNNIFLLIEDRLKILLNL